MLIMQHATRRNFFGRLNHNVARGEILDRDFDDDQNRRPVTAELLDWHQARHWPVLATD